MHYLSTLQKWCVLRDSALIKNLPSYVPGHDFLSSSRAKSLKVPYSKREALIKFNFLQESLKQEWITGGIISNKQKQVVHDLLNLGAYALPKLVITSPMLDLHIRDVMQKEVAKCFADMRKGKEQFSKKES